MSQDDAELCGMGTRIVDLDPPAPKSFDGNRTYFAQTDEDNWLLEHDAQIVNRPGISISFEGTDSEIVKEAIARELNADPNANVAVMIESTLPKEFMQVFYNLTQEGLGLENSYKLAWILLQEWPDCIQNPGIYIKIDDLTGVSPNRFLSKVTFTERVKGEGKTITAEKLVRMRFKEGEGEAKLTLDIVRDLERIESAMPDRLGRLFLVLSPLSSSKTEQIELDRQIEKIQSNINEALLKILEIVPRSNGEWLMQKAISGLQNAVLGYVQYTGRRIEKLISNIPQEDNYLRFWEKVHSEALGIPETAKVLVIADSINARSFVNVLNQESGHRFFRLGEYPQESFWEELVNAVVDAYARKQEYLARYEGRQPRGLAQATLQDIQSLLSEASWQHYTVMLFIREYVKHSNVEHKEQVPRNFYDEKARNIIEKLDPDWHLIKGTRGELLYGPDGAILDSIVKRSPVNTNGDPTVFFPGRFIVDRYVDTMETVLWSLGLPRGWESYKSGKKKK